MTNAGETSRWLTLRVIAISVCAAGILFAQPLSLAVRTPKGPEGAVAEASAHVIRADVNLVLVPAVVTDRKGATVTGLTRDNFTVLENRVPQTIVSLSNQDAPSSIGIVLDLSGSMRTKLEAATDAVRAFLETANREDEIFLLTVGSRPHSLSDFTADFATLQNRIVGARADGDTALMDTVYMGLSRLRSAQNGRGALLVVSDGMDNNSRYSKTELLRVVEECDVQIYTIGIVDAPAWKKAIELTEQSRGLALLSDLADRSGGMSFKAASSDEVKPAALKIGRAIRNEYVIAYGPTSVNNPDKWRSVQVKVSPSQFRVYARRGYYAE
ncbi:MAG: VWA domain-containing protein [Bryobacteraceae bacterium]